MAGLVFVYPMTLGIPLLDPDEGLHASIAQQMVERGDWLVPRFLGEAFLDKPIFYFWAEALSLRLFGMHEAAVRLPGLLFGLLGAVTTGIVGWRMFGRTEGRLAGLFYATMILPVALAQAAAHDVALVPWVNIALLLFWESDRARTRKGALASTAAIGLVLGLSCLTKGLAGVAIVGVTYGAYLLITRRLTPAACGRGAAALAIAAAVAAPWYLAVEFHNPGYFRYYFVQRHLLGYVTSGETHGHAPWWYYLPILLAGGLPWIAYLPVTVRDAWARRKLPAGGDAQPVQAPARRSHGGIVLLWCWLIGGTLFLSISHSKLVTYLWPIFPAVAILAAVAWARFLKGSLNDAARRALARTFVLSGAIIPVLLPVAMFVVQKKFAIQFSPVAWAAVVLATLASWAPVGLWIAGRPRGGLAAAALSLAVQCAAIMTMVMPHVAAATSARELADHFNRRAHVPRRLLFADDRIGSFVFYLDADLRAGLREGQLEQVRLSQLADAEAGTVIVLPQRRAGRAERCPALAGKPYARVGHYRVYEPPAAAALDAAACSRVVLSR